MYQKEFDFVRNVCANEMDSDKPVEKTETKSKTIAKGYEDYS